MIKFCYNYKEERFIDLPEGAFFMVGKEESLYLKIPTVEIYSYLASHSENKPTYNAYSFEAKMLKRIELNRLVTPVNADIEVTPQT